LALARQWELAGVARSTAYAPHKAAGPDAEELALLALIDAEYTRHPFYGSRKMVVYLEQAGYRVNRKRVRRLMGVLGLAGMAPGPDTSRPHPQNKVYPYLLRGLEVDRKQSAAPSVIPHPKLPSSAFLKRKGDGVTDKLEATHRGLAGRRAFTGRVLPAA